jgi:hypothetical protein
MTQNKKSGSAWRLMASRHGGQLGLSENLVRAMTGAMAVASATFATHMIADGERLPEFAGVEYLSVFKRPGSVARRVDGSRSGVEIAVVDRSAVGSIKKKEAGAVAPATSQYHVREASADSALLVAPDRVFRVREGDRIANLGLIVSIEPRMGKWVVVTQSGEITAE